MSNSQFEFSETAEQMHAGAAEWEERREVMEELNEEKCDECDQPFIADTLFNLSVTHGMKLCKGCYCEMFPQNWN